ncbi:MAG TPA: hypothetical protein DDZ89_05990 [Clostridiales bacterium]|nr:hypothetical protein [Clostridiales bacterium]
MNENKIILVNYSYNSSEPLKSITQLSEKEAFAVAEKLYKESQCRAHRRFGPDFPVYYRHRLKTEEWLYDHFVAMGGKPETSHPYYFALQHCESLYRNFEYGKAIKINLSDIHSQDISFTFGDSVAQMGSPERKDPFMKDQLLSYISACDNDVNQFIDSIKEKYVCIEAQLWTDKYFSDLVPVVRNRIE